MYGSQQMQIIEDRRKDVARRIDEKLRVLQDDTEAAIEICVIGGARIIGDWAETTKTEVTILSDSYGVATSETVALEDVVSVAIKQGARKADVVPPRMRDLGIDWFILDGIVRRVGDKAMAAMTLPFDLIEKLNAMTAPGGRLDRTDALFYDAAVQEVQALQKQILTLMAPLLRPAKGQDKPVWGVQHTISHMKDLGLFGDATIADIFKGSFADDDRTDSLRAAFAANPGTLELLMANPTGPEVMPGDLPADLGRLLMGVHVLEHLRSVLRAPYNYRPYMPRELLRQVAAGEFERMVVVDTSGIRSPE